MNICFIGKHLLAPNLADNQLDAPVFLEFAKHFDRVLLIYGTDGPAAVESTDDNVDMHLIPQGPRGFGSMIFIVRAFLAARRWHRRYGIAVVSASDPVGGGVTGVLLKAALRTKLVFQIQGQVLRLPRLSYSAPRRWLTRRLTLLACRIADAVRCVSQEIYTEAVRSGIRADKLAFIPSRCDTELFDPERWNPSSQTMRDRHGIPPGRTVAIFIGRLEPDKGVFELIAAARDVARDIGGDRLHTLLVGDIPDRAAVEQAVTAAGLDDAVTAVGRVAHDEVPRYLAASDVFVLPSKHEGSPRVVLEAMSMALPVIATAVGGIAEAIDDGETGLLLEDGSTGSISVALRRLLSGDVDRSALGRAARRYVEANHSFQPNADRVIALHQSVVSTARGASPASRGPG